MGVGVGLCCLFVGRGCLSYHTGFLTIQVMVESSARVLQTFVQKFDGFADCMFASNLILKMIQYTSTKIEMRLKETVFPSAACMKMVFCMGMLHC